MLYKKVASITVSFSWIFMIIVGSFFLLLAYNIIDNYQGIEAEKLDIERNNAFRSNLNTVGRTTGQEEDSIRPLGAIFRDERVEILCNDGLPLLQIGNEIDPNNDYLDNYPTFMTIIDQGKNDDSYIAVANYRMPFKTTNTLALVSQKNLIVFDNSASFEFKERFEEKLRRESSFRDLNIVEWNLDGGNWDDFRIQYVEDKSLSSIMFVSKEKNVTQDFGVPTYNLNIEYSSQTGIDRTSKGNLTYGNGQYHHFIDWGDSLTVPSMAIFSSPETFECSYMTLLDSIEPAYDYYLTKANETLSRITDDVGAYKSPLKLCSATISGEEEVLKYNSFIDNLESTKGEIASFKNSNDMRSVESVLVELRDLEQSVEELERFNCLLVY